MHTWICNPAIVFFSQNHFLGKYTVFLLTKSSNTFHERFLFQSINPFEASVSFLYHLKTEWIEMKHWLKMD